MQTHSPTALQTTTPPGLHHHCIPSPLLLHAGPLKNVPGRKLAGAIRVLLALYDGAWTARQVPLRLCRAAIGSKNAFNACDQCLRQLSLHWSFSRSVGSNLLPTSSCPPFVWRGSRHGRRLNHSNTSPFQFQRCPAGLFVSLSWVSGWWCHLMSSSFLAALSRLVCTRRGERRALISRASPSLP